MKYLICLCGEKTENIGNTVYIICSKCHSKYQDGKWITILEQIKPTDPSVVLFTKEAINKYKNTLRKLSRE